MSWQRSRGHRTWQLLESGHERSQILIKSVKNTSEALKSGRGLHLGLRRGGPRLIMFKTATFERPVFSQRTLLHFGAGAFKNRNTCFSLLHGENFVTTLKFIRLEKRLL